MTPANPAAIYTGWRQARSGLTAASSTGTTSTVNNANHIAVRRKPPPQAGWSTKWASSEVSRALDMTGLRKTVWNSPLS